MQSAQRGWSRVLGDATALYERARNWAIGSDPGLLRLRMATRTTGALATALLVLFLLTKATHQPLTVALLGALITMVSARSVNEPDPRRQRVTMALLPLPTALAIAAAALVSPHPVIANVLFVGVVFVAAYARRFGPRGTSLGMVTFMSYFFSLYLQAKFSELPWLIGATLVGTLCSYLWSAFILPDRPESVLRENIRALRARMAIAVDTTADTVRIGNPDERRQRRLRIRLRRLNETALMVQAQIEDRVNPEPAMAGSQRRGPRAVAVRRRAHRRTPRDRGHPGGLRRHSRRHARRIGRHGGHAGAGDPDAAHRRPPADRAAGSAAARTASGRRAGATVGAGDRRHGQSHRRSPPAHRAGRDRRCRAARRPAPDEQQLRPGMLPTTRQAIQVAVAAALAIVVGETVSPSHWYWAAIAAFVIFAGTNSWAETLDKGWQRLLGTVLGVPSGVLVATLVSGNTIASLAMIFVCLFCAFYFMKVAYSLMTFWISTMLALMYGLLGEFTFGLLLLRIEETAVGAVIGIAAAMLVLPINTRAKIRGDAHTFFLTLSDLVEASVASLLGTPAPTRLTETARQLGRDLAQFRITAKPMSAGVAGLAGRRTMRHGLRMLTACDRYARILARSSEIHIDTSPGIGERDPIDCDADPPQHRHADHVVGVQPARGRLSVHRLHRRRGDARPAARRSAAGSPTADERIACTAPSRPRRHQRRCRPRRR